MEKTTTTIKILLWGFGKTNQHCLSYLSLNSQYEVLGVIGKHDIGINAYEVIKDKNNTKNNNKLIIISYLEADEYLSKLLPKPDICILAIKSKLSEIEPSLEICAKHKINVLTLAEECFYSWGSSPELTKKLDDLFKKNDILFTGTGYQDVFLGYLPVMLTAGCLSVKKIYTSVSYDIDNYSKSICESAGIGFSIEEFKSTFKDNKFEKTLNYSRFNVEWIAAFFNTKILKYSQKYIPIFAGYEIESKGLGRILTKHQVIASKINYCCECENGFIIECDIISQIEKNPIAKILIEGETEISLCFKADDVEVINAIVMNRIKDVLNSKEKGYIPTYKFGIPVLKN